MVSVEMVTALFAGFATLMSAPGVAAWFKAKEAAIQARRSVHESKNDAQTILNSIAKISVAINGRVTQLLEGKDEVNQAQAKSIQRLEAIIANLHEVLVALVAGRKDDAAALLRLPQGTQDAPIHVAIDATPATQDEQAGVPESS
jgi:hypothetical protein